MLVSEDADALQRMYGRETNLDLGLGDIERQVAEDDLAACVAASAGDDNGRLVAVRGCNHGSVLSAAADSGSLGARSRAATTATTTLAVATGGGLLRAFGHDLVEGCVSQSKTSQGEQIGECGTGRVRQEFAEEIGKHRWQVASHGFDRTEASVVARSHEARNGAV